MPTISWFYGIAIRMYFVDHPPSHFQAVYGEHEANVAIETGEVIAGRLPPMAARLVKQWTVMHRAELEGSAHVLSCRSNALQDSTMINVSKINALGDHRLQFRFTDETVGEYDFSALVNEPGPMVEPLRDVNYFNRVFLEFGAPTWPNGFDIAPEWLHRELLAAGKLMRETTA